MLLTLQTRARRQMHNPCTRTLLGTSGHFTQHSRIPTREQRGATTARERTPLERGVRSRSSPRGRAKRAHHAHMHPAARLPHLPRLLLTLLRARRHLWHAREHSQPTDHAWKRGRPAAVLVPTRDRASAAASAWRRPARRPCTCAAAARRGRRPPHPCPACPGQQARGARAGRGRAPRARAGQARWALGRERRIAAQRSAVHRCVIFEGVEIAIFEDDSHLFWWWWCLNELNEPARSQGRIPFFGDSGGVHRPPYAGASVGERVCCGRALCATRGVTPPSHSTCGPVAQRHRRALGRGRA